MKKYNEILERMKADAKASADKRPVYIIEGAPGSGKTTYVQSRKQPGDIVIDLDLLASALQGDVVAHPDYTPVMDAVISAREAVYKTIRNRSGQWKSAYIIISSSDAKHVESIADQLGGTVVTMDTDLGQCITQIQNDPTRPNKEHDIKLAQQWYDSRK